MSRHDPFIEKIREVAVGGPGVLDPELRRRAFSGEPLPQGLEAFAAMVRDRAAAIGDADVERLRATLSEDQVFELTVCAATGAAFRRLAAARAVLGRE